jgi:hypothetical protein
LAVAPGVEVPLTEATPAPSSRFAQPAITTIARIGTHTARMGFLIGRVEQSAGNTGVTAPVTPV